jgi:hypothetical protein
MAAPPKKTEMILSMKLWLSAKEYHGGVLQSIAGIAMEVGLRFSWADPPGRVNTEQSPPL